MGKDDFTGRTSVATARRKLGGLGSVDPGLAEPGGLSIVTSQLPPPPAKPEHHMRETPVVVEDAAISMFLRGENGRVVTPKEVEERYSLRAGYLGNALRRRYGSTAALKEALQGSLLESALVMAEHAMLHVQDMTPAQAILGTKIATDAALAIEKSRREAPKTIDFGQLAVIGEGLLRLNALAEGTVPGDEEATGLEIRSSGDDVISRY